MKSLQELEQIRQQALEKVNIRTEKNGTKIVIGMGTCGIAVGARPVLMALLEESKKRKVQNVIISQTGCMGMCSLEPMVEVYKEGEGKTTYVKMTAEKVQRVILEHIVNGKTVEEFTIGAYEK